MDWNKLKSFYEVAIYKSISTHQKPSKSLLSGDPLHVERAVNRQPGYPARISESRSLVSSFEKILIFENLAAPLNGCFVYLM